MPETGPSLLWIQFDNSTGKFQFMQSFALVEQNLRVVPHQSILVVKSSPACELAHAALICHVVWATTLSESARTRFDPLLELHTVVAQLRS